MSALPVNHRVPRRKADYCIALKRTVAGAECAYVHAYSKHCRKGEVRESGAEHGSVILPAQSRSYKAHGE